MKRVRSILPLCAVFALSGCIEIEPTIPNTAAQTARAKFHASALSTYALTHANAQMTPGIVTVAPEARAASMLCPFYDGTRGALFLAWSTSIGGDQWGGEVVAQAASQIGSRAAVKASETPLVIEGRDLSTLPGCALPPLEKGTPIVGVLVQVKASSLVETAKEEMQATDCPAGTAGTIIRRRVVAYSTEAPPVYGDWKTDTMGACLPVARITTAQEIVSMDAWTKGGVSSIDRALEENSPKTCKRVTVKSEFNGEADQYTVDTCAGVELRQVAACPPAPIVLPPMSSKLEYAAAIAPLESDLRKLPSSCQVVVTSDANWPLWTTFNIEATGGSITRLYTGRIPMRWTGQGGDISFSFSAYSWRSLYAIPDYLTTDPEHWLLLTWRNAAQRSGAVSSMNGRGYWEYTGPNTAKAQGKLGGYTPGNFPVPYPNDGPNPWGNTPEQQKYRHGFSYNAFASRHYVYEGGF